MPPVFLRLAAVAGLAAMLAFLSPDPARAANDNFSPAQKKQVEEIVRQYLLKNPELLIEAINTLRAREEAEEAKGQGDAIASRRAELERDPASPVGGNPKGDVTLVEFFDYRCGYCKRVHETVRDLVKADGNIRLVYKELPLLGPESLFAARAAVAAFKIAPDKYRALHDKLMAMPSGAVKEDNVMAEVKSVGLDVKAVRQRMDDPAVAADLERVQSLAQALRLRGTPSFVVGDILIPGAVDGETLKKVIAEVRAQKKS